MDSRYELKLINEFIDPISSCIKSSSLLFDTKKIEHIYSYLLLHSTAIERLQKLIYIVDSEEKTAKEITDSKLKNLGHNLLSIHEKEMLIYFKKEEFVYYKKTLEILTELVTNTNKNSSGYRYSNINPRDNMIFNIQEHVCKIFELLPNFDGKNDLVLIGWNIINIILTKYISVLNNNIWNKKCFINPISLQNYVTKCYSEIDLKKKINEVLSD